MSTELHDSLSPETDLDVEDDERFMQRINSAGAQFVHHTAITDDLDGQDDVDDDYGLDDAALDEVIAGINNGQDNEDRGAGGIEHRAKRRFDPGVAWAFAGIAAVAVVVTLIAAVVFYSGDNAPASPVRSSLADPQAVAVAKPAPPTDSTGVLSGDRPLPYAADAADSCPAGSTSAQTMSGADPRNAFVCVRNGLDGQVINIDLGKTYVITALSLTPGWVGLDASGVSQWTQHRVITTVQYRFNDTDRTLITQDTKNVHGEAVQPVKRVLASKIQMLIRQTSRPPAEPATGSPGTDSGAGGGLTSVFGQDAPIPGSSSPDAVFGSAAAQNSDPVDATFAISGLKIIGHEAI